MKEKKENILRLMYKENTTDFKWATKNEIPELKKLGYKFFKENEK